MTSLLTRIHALAKRSGWPDFICNKFNLIQLSGSLYSRGKDDVFYKELFGHHKTLHH